MLFFVFVRLIYRCRTTFKKQTDILCVVVVEILRSKTQQIVVVFLFVSSGIPKHHSKSSPNKDPQLPQKWSWDPSGRVQKRPQNQFGTQTETKPTKITKKEFIPPLSLFDQFLSKNRNMPLRGDFFARHFPNRVLE